MKLIIAIIQPHHLDSVKNALKQVEVFRLTIMDCQGFGRQQGHEPMVDADELTVNLRRKIQLQIAVNEEFVDPCLLYTSPSPRDLSTSRMPSSA